MAQDHYNLMFSLRRISAMTNDPPG